MESFVCENCGASEWRIIDGYKVCAFCGTKYKHNEATIDLNSDIKNLLEKCKSDPKNAKKYANLILDIDSTNQDALKYL